MFPKLRRRDLPNLHISCTAAGTYLAKQVCGGDSISGCGPGLLKGHLHRLRLLLRAGLSVPPGQHSKFLGVLLAHKQSGLDARSKRRQAVRTQAANSTPNSVNSANTRSQAASTPAIAAASHQAQEQAIRPQEGMSRVATTSGLVALCTAPTHAFQPFLYHRRLVHASCSSCNSQI